MRLTATFQPTWAVPAPASSRSAPRHPPVARPAPPQDPAQLAAAVARTEAAIVRLVRLGMVEDAALMREHGSWPDAVRCGPPLERLLLHPAGMACRAAIKQLWRHLSDLIGAEAATAIVRRLEAEQCERAVAGFPTAGAA